VGKGSKSLWAPNRETWVDSVVSCDGRVGKNSNRANGVNTDRPQSGQFGVRCVRGLLAWQRASGAREWWVGKRENAGRRALRVPHEPGFERIRGGRKGKACRATCLFEDIRLPSDRTSRASASQSGYVAYVGNVMPSLAIRAHMIGSKCWMW
jgi:hypothetical protein